MSAKIKALFLFQITFQIISNISSIFFPVDLSKYCFEFIKFWTSHFKGFLYGNFRLPTVNIGKPRTAFILKYTHRRAKRSEIWASNQYIQGTLTIRCSRSFWGHSVHFPFSATLYLENVWLLNWTFETLGFWGKYSIYTGYFWQLLWCHWVHLRFSTIMYMCQKNAGCRAKRTKVWTWEITIQYIQSTFRS